MVEVAPLAQSRQVHQRRRLRAMIENVSRGENDMASSDGMWAVVFSTAPFATIPGSHESNEVASSFPILRVSVLVLWSDRQFVTYPSPIAASKAASVNSKLISVQQTIT